ncbi:class I SAM-dependent methyltransferase [Paraburkholderia sp. BCC1884]|uniref:class I SAM-dependent methyltransferase n=1 Tax=Paraburkholderia sp. BCC1884 TaxID=2562668 RepID=UPI0011820ADF|nr:class I SAM-dependent methyltransferase [Paraburkholderia sp. BCC1884]
MSTPAANLHGLGEPSRWVRHWAHLVAARGAVLDVASGAGRHARYFASLGHPVTAVDRDSAALETLLDEPLVTPLTADLEGGAWPLPAEATFAAVVVTNYLHRPLFPQLLSALAPGGVLVYETFAQGNESVGKPSNPAFLLAPGELLERVHGHLRVVAYQDGFLAQPRPAYVQRICAILETERPANPSQAVPPPCYELAG